MISHYFDDSENPFLSAAREQNKTSLILKPNHHKQQDVRLQGCEFTFYYSSKLSSHSTSPTSRESIRSFGCSSKRFVSKKYGTRCILFFFNPPHHHHHHRTGFNLSVHATTPIVQSWILSTNLQLVGEGRGRGFTPPLLRAINKCTKDGWNVPRRAGTVVCLCVPLF